MAYAEMLHYFPGRSLKSLQHKVARLKMGSNSSTSRVELSSERHPVLRLGDSISASVSTQRQTRLPFLPDKGKGRADGKPRIDRRVGFTGRKSSEQFPRTPRHPDVIITVNTRLSQEFLAESIRQAVNGDDEDPIEDDDDDDDDDGQSDVNVNQDLMEMEDEIPMEDMIEAEKEMSSSRALDTAEDCVDVDGMTEEQQAGNTIDNPVSVSSDSGPLDIYDLPSSPPRENWMSAYEEVVPVEKNSAQRKVDRKCILTGSQEMDWMQPWDPVAEEFGHYNRDSTDEVREEAWCRAVAVNMNEVPVPAESDQPHPSDHHTSQSPVVERTEEVQMASIASHSESEDESDSDGSDTSSELTNDSSSEVSSSSEASNDAFIGASDLPLQSTRIIPDSLDTNGQTQSTPPAVSSSKESREHKSPTNPFLNAWPNMSKRPPNWHSGMTDSESEGSSSSSDSDNEYEWVKKTSKPTLTRNSTITVQHFESNRDKGGIINGSEWVIDGKSDDAGRKKQNEEMITSTNKKATSKQCMHERPDHIHEAQSADRQRDGDTVVHMNEEQPTKRKSSKTKRTQNKGIQPVADQHIHNTTSGNGSRAFSNHHDKTVTTPTATEEKSSRFVDRGVQATSCVSSMTLSGFRKSTESGKSRARRARRQRSKSRLATKRQASGWNQGTRS